MMIAIIRIGFSSAVAVMIAAMFTLSAESQTTGNAQGATVTMEWLGWSHYRFTSPNSKVVLTNPFVNNPDSPVKLEDITQADIILPADGHGDDMGQALQIAQQTGGTIVTPSFEMGTWFLEKGVPRSQVDQMGGPGDWAKIDDIAVHVVSSVHGSGLGQQATQDVPYGGPAAGFVVTFENGWTVYFAGSSAAHEDQVLIAQMFHPNLAILALDGTHDPVDFAEQVKLLMTDNPNLTAVFPHHLRVTSQPGQTTVADAQAAVQAMGISMQITTPVLGQIYSFTN
jgi:L-ascorbate metabolism protein UlaG (beta-lactamase superfamily)